ncbi:hypothetical protein WN943_001675 [Citrus x changshan-huyou]
MLMRDSGYTLPTTRISARPTSPRSKSLLVRFLLQVFLRPQKQVRARRLVFRLKSSDAQVRYEGSGNACHGSYGFSASSESRSSAVYARHSPHSRMWKPHYRHCGRMESDLDTPARRTLPPDTCSSRLVSSIYFPRTLTIRGSTSQKEKIQWWISCRILPHRRIKCSTKESVLDRLREAYDISEDIYLKHKDDYSFKEEGKVQLLPLRGFKDDGVVLIEEEVGLGDFN